MRALAFVSVLAATWLAGCASLPDAACPIDQSLRQPGAGGCDNQALVELGQRYESGDGVPQDFGKAAALYKAAATSQPSVIYVYSPAVGRESYGRVIPVRTGPGRAASPEARYRLGLLTLKGAGVKQDRKKAESLLRSAAQDGFAPAEQALADMSKE